MDNKDVFIENEKKYNVGGEILTLKPLKLKKFKGLLKLVEEAISNLQQISDKNKLVDIADMVMNKNHEIMSFLFPIESYTFMTTDFIDDNFTIPLTRAIIEDMIEMNGLKDFFPMLNKNQEVSPKK